MQAKNEALRLKQYIEDLHEDILWSKDETIVAQQLYTSAQEAHNAAENLHSVLTNCDFFTEAESIGRLISKLSRILTFRETEFENASDEYKELMRDLEQAKREQTEAA